MNQKKNATWSDAISASPGPQYWKEAFILMLKGFCMGSADIIPGVSGGTIALIAGIYHSLLKAIQSANVAFFRSLVSFRWKDALAQLHIRFLIPLFLGIIVAIVSLARVMNYLLIAHPVYTWSLFFGLIAASILLVGKKVENWNIKSILAAILGGVLGFVIVGLIPVSTPNALWFIFFAGTLAICAMILPGVSGAFILLMLGKYEYVTGALKNPFLAQNSVIILVFCFGCLVGLMGFSRILSFMLDRYHSMTIALLMGLMAGSLRKVWPWKEVVEEKMIRGKMHVLKESNQLPELFSNHSYIAFGLIFLGFILIVILDKFSEKQNA
ncbi:MAG: putative membrane protein [bacterium]|jgi:putative membrane protein